MKGGGISDMDDDLFDDFEDETNEVDRYIDDLYLIKNIEIIVLGMVIIIIHIYTIDILIQHFIYQHLH